MPTMRLDSIDLHYEDQGKGPVIAMVHWGTQEVFKRLTSDFRVCMIHQRGNGMSPPWPRMSLADWMLDLEGFIDELNIGPCHVFGVSGGGASALQLAARRPDLIKSLTLHEPAMVNMLKHDPATYSLYEEHVLLKAKAAELAQAGKPEEGIRYFVSHVSPEKWGALSQAEREARLKIAMPMLLEQIKTWDTQPGHYMDIDATLMRRITQPVLLTCGEKTDPIFKAVAKKLAAGLPNCELRSLPGQGHDATGEHADGYAQLLREFVRKQEA